MLQSLIQSNSQNHYELAHNMVKSIPYLIRPLSFHAVDIKMTNGKFN